MESSAPLPPADLMLRVVGSFGPEDIESAAQAFDRGGRNNLALFEHALAAVPQYRLGGEVWLDHDQAAATRSIGDFRRVLDFGCGCGRLLRHLQDVADRVEVHGTDLDVEMVGWLQANMPFGHYEVASPEPPLPYADGYFDLVLSHSVFTHLDERHQDRWLEELRRITQPEGLLLITVHGQSMWTRTRQDSEKTGFDTSVWQNELDQRGVLFIANDAFVGSTHPDFYHSTIHTPSYVFDHWSRFFEVAAYVVEGAWGQDLVVLRRTAEMPAQPHPIEPASPPPARRLISRTRHAGRRAAMKLQPGSTAELQQLSREVAMLRAGLYEQGQRISVLAAQLREEIRSLRR